MTLSNGDELLCNNCLQTHTEADRARYPVALALSQNDQAGNYGNNSRAIVQEKPVVINEILCYIQNRMDNMAVDILSKILCDFYSETQISAAKNLLFEKCQIERGSRLIKRIGPNKKNSDVQDIITRFNEVGLDAPNFAAFNLANLPPTSLDSFDMAKLSMNLTNVSDTLAMLSCLQSDLNSVLKRSTEIADVAAEVVAVKSMVQNLAAHQPSTSVSSVPNSDDRDHEYDADVTTIPETQLTQTSDIVPGSEESSSSDADTDADDEADQVEPNNNITFEADAFTQTTPTRDHRDDGGFTTVRRTQRPRNKAKFQRTYAEITSSDKSKTNMTVNVNGKHKKLNVNGKHNKLKVANRAQPNSSILRTATHVAKVSNRNVTHSRFSSIFVSRLHASTSVQDIKFHMNELCKDKIRIEKLVTKYNGYSSFKLSVPNKVKGTALNRQNWPEGVYIRTFIESH